MIYHLRNKISVSFYKSFKDILKCIISIHYLIIAENNILCICLFYCLILQFFFRVCLYIENISIYKTVFFNLCSVYVNKIAQDSLSTRMEYNQALCFDKTLANKFFKTDFIKQIFPYTRLFSSTSVLIASGTTILIPTRFCFVRLLRHSTEILFLR